MSIGIPTYNRARLLDGAIASALGQTYSDIEVVVSDNASSDETPDICATWGERDQRVRVVRHATNLGPTANFNSLFKAVRGDYVLMLSDDDRLDGDYVERCVALLERERNLAVVAGTARYVRDGVFAREGPVTSLRQATARERVSAYFSAPDDGPFYGVVRAVALRAAGEMPNVLANDWLHIGRLAASGQIAMRTDTHVTRELGGTSESIESILATFGTAGAAARVPHLVMARHVATDILSRSPVREQLGPFASRLPLAARCAIGVIDAKSLAWHLTAPTFAALARRPRGRPLARAYKRITRALGAGRR